MTKVRIEPGICGFTAIAEAEAAEGRFTPTPRSISPFTPPAPSSPGSPSAQKRNAILLSGRTPGYFLRNNAPKGRLRFSFYVEKQTPS